MKKKWMAILCATGMMASLTACGSAGNTAATDAAKPADAAASAESSATIDISGAKRTAQS